MWREQCCWCTGSGRGRRTASASTHHLEPPNMQARRPPRPPRRRRLLPLSRRPLAARPTAASASCPPPRRPSTTPPRTFAPRRSRARPLARPSSVLRSPPAPCSSSLPAASLAVVLSSLSSSTLVSSLSPGPTSESRLGTVQSKRTLLCATFLRSAARPSPACPYSELTSGSTVFPSAASRRRT